MGRTPSRSEVESLIHKAKHWKANTPSWSLKQGTSEGLRAFDSRRQIHYNSAISRLTPRILQQLMDKWQRHFDMSSCISLSDTDATSYFDVDSIVAQTRTLFQKCRNNNDLHDYTVSVEQAIPSFYHTSSAFPTAPNVVRSPLPFASNPAITYHQVTVSTLASQVVPPTCPVLPTAPTCLVTSSLFTTAHDSATHSHLALEQLITELSSNSQGLRQDYGTGLRRSLKKLQESTASASSDGIASTMEAVQQRVQQFVEDCKHLTGDVWDAIKSILLPRFNESSSKSDQILLLGGLWPCVSPRSLLVQMTRDAWPEMSTGWQDVLSHLAAGIILSQQAGRMNRFAALGKTQELQREVQNCGPIDVELLMQNPDWALVQVRGHASAKL